MEALLDPGRGDIKAGLGKKIPFTSLSVQTTGSPSARPAFISLIKSCIALAMEASSVPGIWGGGDAVRDAMT